MPDITEYTDQIAKAVYGEEVRGSIINALNKVNDDNNSYSAIKTAVEAAQADVDSQVAAFDAKVTNASSVTNALTAATSAANTAKTNVVNATTAANTAKTNLTNATSTASSTKSALDTSVSNANTAKTNADNAKSQLQTVVDNAGVSKTALQNAIDNATSIKSQLEASNTLGAQTKTNLDTAITNATNAKTELQTVIDSAEETKSDLSATIQAANQKQDDLDASISSATTAKTNLDSANAIAVENYGKLTNESFKSQDILDGVKKAQLVNSISGTKLNVNDSAVEPIRGLSVRGKMTQDGSPNPDAPAEITVVEDNVTVSVNDSSLQFNLPTEHPFIASLPTGAYDEVMVDADGKKKLIARIGKVVLNGSESWGLNGHAQIAGQDDMRYMTYITGKKFGMYNFVNDRFDKIENQEIALGRTAHNGIEFVIFKYRAADVSAFKTWLASNPITLYYELETPITYELSESVIPQMGDGETVVSNDKSLLMSLDYVSNIKRYVDNGLYSIGGAITDTVSGAIAKPEMHQVGSPADVVVNGAYKQDGTPTPDAPVPVEVITDSVDVVSSGKNLFKTPFVAGTTKTSNGLTYTFNADGSVKVTGTATSWSEVRIKNNLTLPAGTYTISGGGAGSCYAFVSSLCTAASNITGIVDEQATYSYGICASSGTTVDTTIYPQLEVGTVATAYEPYAAPTTTTIDLQSHELAALPNGTKDTLEVDAAGHVTLTQRVGKTVLDGTETFAGQATQIGDVYRILVTKNGVAATSYKSGETGRAVATWFGSSIDVYSTLATEHFYATGNSFYFFTEYQTPAALKAGVTASQVTVYYELATPITVDLGMADAITADNTLYSTHALAPVLDVTYVQNSTKVINQLREMIIALGN